MKFLIALALIGIAAVSASSFDGQAVLFQCTNSSTCDPSSCSNMTFTTGCNKMGSSKSVRAHCANNGVIFIEYEDDSCKTFKAAAEVPYNTCQKDHDDTFNRWGCTKPVPSPMDTTVTVSQCGKDSTCASSGCNKVTLDQEFCYRDDSKPNAGFRVQCASNGLVALNYDNQGCIGTPTAVVAEYNKCYEDHRGNYSSFSCQKRTPAVIAITQCNSTDCEASTCQSPFPIAKEGECGPNKNDGHKESVRFYCQSFGLEALLYRDQTCGGQPFAKMVMPENQCRMDRKDKTYQYMSCIPVPGAPKRVSADRASEVMRKFLA